MTNAASNPGPCVSKLDASVVIISHASHKKPAKEMPRKRIAVYLRIFIIIKHQTKRCTLTSAVLL